MSKTYHQYPILYLLCVIFFSNTAVAQTKHQYSVSSPDQKIWVHVHVKEKISWTAIYKGDTLIREGLMSMQLSAGEVIGKKPKLVSAKVESKSGSIVAFNYKKSSVEDNYQQLTLSLKGNYKIVFRAYNDGVAYRFITDRKDSLQIIKEEAIISFPKDPKAYVPYVNDPRNGDIFMCSFENTYQYARISELKRDTLSFLPILVEGKGKTKVGITEADLEDYPGMFVRSGEKGFNGVHAPYPLAEKKSERRNLQVFVSKRADYIARTSGKRSFPWRVFIVAEEDKDLLNNDMIYRLAEPSRIQDISWIKPGKVAWDWWNNWNVSGVDFKAGINTETYKHYIDFANAFHLEYIMLDEGWALNNNLLEVVPSLDLPEIIRYAREKKIGVWLWAAYAALNDTMDEAMTKYSALGVVGFKVDFMDRDDQKMIRFYYTLAKKAADYHLMLDLHGAYKPTGLQRTYPNVMNFEGVRGLENVKWTNEDFPLYNCTAPYIRMLAGPLDYTPGAMKNANKVSFRSVYGAPMSQGTRCQQLALYVIYEAPLSMLADTPSNYWKERECTEFIGSVPTFFDETVVLAGEISKYAAIARRKDIVWYLGAVTTWEGRTLNIPLSFLGKGNFEIEIFQDGINADREATDYKKIVKQITSSESLNVTMASGGGWAARIIPK